MADRRFGSPPGVPVGTPFGTRAQAARAGVHGPLQAGISGSASGGADSIVISGGYEDDEDSGDAVIYTGHGGNDPTTGQQVADQTLTRQNMALAVSSDRGLPVRVLRGAGGDASHSPPSGYRFDGLYYVESYWKAKGRAGFDIWRFRLVRSPQENWTTNPPPGTPPAGSGQRAYATVQRLVRNTTVTEWVKELYAFTCQVCGIRMETPAGPYAEGGHIRPVGRPHNGPDTPSNVLCLCPNDHVLLDRGVIGLDGNLNVIDFVTGRVVGALTLRAGHELDVDHAHYQWALYH